MFWSRPMIRPPLWFAVSILFCLFLPSAPSLSQVVINELMPANVDCLWDEDGQTSDWIELLNTGSQTVDLSGWGLSDNSSQPLKWAFPPYQLPAGQHLLVYASGQDRPASPFWLTLIDRGALFRYRPNETAPASGWHLPGFDDSLWSEGPSGFGNGDNDDNTILPPCQSASLRHRFNIDDPSTVSLLVFHVDYDDAVVAWLNGQEIIRENLSPEGEVAWDEAAGFSHEAGMYYGEKPQRFIFSTEQHPLLPGENLLSIEVHNVSNINSDLTMIPFLTLGLISEPEGGTQVSSEIENQLPLLHTNFQLSAAGEVVLLTNAWFAPMDAVSFGAMGADLSFGRSPEGTGPWFMMDTPTPGQINSSQVYNGTSQAPQFDVDGGIFSSNVTVQLLPSTDNPPVRYTLNSTEPDETSPLWTGPLTVEETTVLRARVFEAGLLPSPITTETYLLNDACTLPITSFVSEPMHLYDRNAGILYEDNIWEDWERPMHLEYFETDGTRVLSQDAGVQVFGGGSRVFAQKSLRLIARSAYGADRFNGPVFPDRGLSSFKQLVWRNSGSEWRYTMCRDGLAHRLIADTGIDHLAWRPSRIYLNGEYWGLLNTREHVDADYIADHHGLDADDLDLIKNHDEVKAGDLENYEAMIDYVRYNWPGNPDNYALMPDLMDIDNFIDYQFIEIFLANTDWPGQNIACWRERNAQGRWRWILFDTDFGLGMRGYHDHNTLEFALSFSNDSWPNPYHSTYLFRSLMASQEFEDRFINRACDLLNTTFRSDCTEPIRQEVRAAIEPEILRHRERWDHSLAFWETQMGVMEEFLQLRPATVREHLRERFELEDDVSLTVMVAPVGQGNIQLSAASVDSFFTGDYFRNHDLQITAQPAPGFVFSGWANPERPFEPSLTLNMADHDTLIANFAPAPAPATVVINEICYHPSDSWNTGDWVELHNPGTEAVDLSGWQFRDEADTHLFVLAGGTNLPAGGFLILCNSVTSFQTLHPEVTPVLGDLGFGFSGSGELLRLFDSFATLVDQVTYDDTAPWPTAPDGTGPTLELIDPWLDNSLASSWSASQGHGSPGLANTMLSNVVDDQPRLALALLKPHPNPFNPLTRIAFTLDETRAMTLAIYDLAGRRVRTLVHSELPAGQHHLIWTGDDDHGQRLASGVYLVRMVAPGFEATRKVMLVK